MKEKLYEERLESCTATEIDDKSLASAKELDPGALVGDFIVKRHGNGSDEDMRRPAHLVRRAEFLRTWREVEKA